MQINNPKQTASEFCQSGVAKAQMPLSRFAILAFLGGVFIAFAGLLSVVLAGGIPEIHITNPGIGRFVAGALFPVGLVMVAIAGADLFTSDCAAMTLAILQRKVTLGNLLKVWIFAYLFNFLGTQFVAYFMANETGMFASEPWYSYLHKSAGARVSMSFYTVFLKGLGANWLVCLAVWMSFAAKDIVGKVIGIWIPVMLFVIFGYEHSIANMFFIPSAIYSGADILWSDFLLKNLLPATLGNIVGGAGFVGCLYWYVFLKDTVDYKHN